MEVGGCTRYLLDFVPGKNPRLISFALPGVTDYNFGEGKSLKDYLTRYHLVDRGDFKGHGAVYHWKTTEEMIALADKAIAAGGMEFLVVHGVERITPNWGFQDMRPSSRTSSRRYWTRSRSGWTGETSGSPTTSLPTSMRPSSRARKCGWCWQTRRGIRLECSNSATHQL